MENQPQKPTTSHSFYCQPCKQKFSIESELEDVVALAKEIKITCPKCSKVWGSPDAIIEHQINVPAIAGKRDINNLRKANIEHSHFAQAEASHYRQTHQDEFAEERVARPQDAGRSKGAIQRGNPVESIPKSVINSLIEKAKEQSEG
jgi:hypothetical protein